MNTRSCPIKLRAPVITNFIVRQGALAVRFELTLTAKSVYELVADKNATTFSTADEEESMARKFGLRMGQYKICPVAGGF